MMEAYERNYSSPSELENLSDSDWLDIASSRTSEDNDSLAAFDDSDREDVYDRPSSRRSFTSIASSRDGVVEGWEGLIEDSSDEAPLSRRDSSADLLSSPPEDMPDENVASSLPAETDLEEERVKAALDQSMMSTLSSSRSNSLAGSSIQTSIHRSSRDLRLSFPDPLTSSLDEPLNSSYENLSSTGPDTADAEAINSKPAPTAADPGSLSTPEVPQNRLTARDYADVPSAITPDFCIVLYGLSSLAKSSLIDSFLEKWAAAAGLVPSCNITHAPGVTARVFVSEGSVQEGKQSRRVVSVIDKTGLESSNNSFESRQPSCPSIAVVALSPFCNVSMSDHTLYLPVVMPSPLAMVDVFASSDYLLDAEQQWETMGIPSSKLTMLSNWSTPVVDQERLEQATAAQVHNALKPLYNKSPKKGTRGSLSTHAILLAVISLVLGYAVKSSLRSSAAVSIYPTEHGTWGLMRPQVTRVNKSASDSIAPVPFPVSAVASSSSKDSEVAVFSPMTPSTSTVSVFRQSPMPSASTSGGCRAAVGSCAPTECNCGCGLITWPSGHSTDLMLRPSASTPALTTHAQAKSIIAFVPPAQPHSHHGNAKGKGKATTYEGDTSLYSLSTRIVGSISEYLDFGTMITTSLAASKELQELLDAIDQLVSAIGRQTAFLYEQSRGTIAVVRNNIRQRNERAKEKAKQLKDMGERFLFSVGKKIRGKTEVAKENAKIIKKNIDAKREVRKLLKARRGEAMKVRRMKRNERREARRAARVL